MDLTKLFRLLVVGGAVMAGAPSCGPEDAPGPSGPGGGVQTSADASTRDAGLPGDGSGGGAAGTGGGVNFW